MSETHLAAIVSGVAALWLPLPAEIRPGPCWLPSPRTRREAPEYRPLDQLFPCGGDPKRAMDLCRRFCLDGKVLRKPWPERSGINAALLCAVAGLLADAGAAAPRLQTYRPQMSDALRLYGLVSGEPAAAVVMPVSLFA